MLKDLGIFKLKEVEESEIFYVTIDYRGLIFISNNYNEVRDPHEKRDIRKIKVYHSGTYFGTPEDMYNWIENETIDYLIKQGMIIEDGINGLGDKIWKWS